MLPASDMETCPHGKMWMMSDIGRGIAARACEEGMEKSGVKERVMFCVYVCRLHARGLIAC